MEIDDEEESCEIFLIFIDHDLLIRLNFLKSTLSSTFLSASDNSLCIDG